MPSKLIIALTILTVSVFYSKRKFFDMKKQLHSYKSFVDLASLCENNLIDDFDNISNIISTHLNISDLSELTPALLKSMGINGDDIDVIMDYTIKYNRLNIFDLRNESSKFTDYINQAYRKKETEYRKSLPTLLCPPTCALIVLILII